MDRSYQSPLTPCRVMAPAAALAVSGASPGVAHVGHYRSAPLARPVVLPTIACQAAALAMIAMMWRCCVRCSRAVPDRPGSPWRIRGVKGCWRIERGRRAPDLRGNLRPVGGTKRPRRSGRRRENAGQPSLSCGSLAVDTRHSPCFSTLHSPRRTVSVRCRACRVTSLDPRCLVSLCAGYHCSRHRCVRTRWCGGASDSRGATAACATGRVGATDTTARGARGLCRNRHLRDLPHRGG